MRILALLLPATAFAAPFDLLHTGRALDASGGPVNGSYPLELRLIDTLDDSQLWSTDYGDIPFDGGYFAVTLTDLDTEWFSRDLELEVRVDDVALAPRTPLVSVPRALVASSAPIGGAAEVAAGCTGRGQLLYDTVNEALLVCDGSDWFSVGAQVRLTGAGTAGNPYLLDPVPNGCRAYAEALDDAQDGVYQIDASGDGQAPYRTAYCDFTDEWEIHLEAVNENLAGTRSFCTSRSLHLEVPADFAEAERLSTRFGEAHGTSRSVRLDMDIRINGGCNSSQTARSNSAAYRQITPFTLPGGSQCSAANGGNYIVGSQVRIGGGTFYAAVGSGNHGGNNHTSWTQVCNSANSGSCNSFASGSAGPFPVCGW